MLAKLILKDGITLKGESFSYEEGRAGELVFATGMMGYPESLTDPSYEGQILVLTYPIVGNYGIPDKKYWESSRIHVSGLIVSQYIDTPSHFLSKMTLADWLKKEKIPGLMIDDTRQLTIKLRTEGAQLAKIIFEKDIDFVDPNKRNLAAEVSINHMKEEGSGKKIIILIDCGAKRNISRSLLKRNVRLITVPWDFDFMEKNIKFDGVLISNGPGDPKMMKETIAIVRKVIEAKKPILGICFGNQILGLAAGGDTYKLKFGHRSQNQPCLLLGTKKCYITTQNHGFAVGKIPFGFRPWFINANDGTNEGIIHKKYPFMSVQFHPEASPGPVDTEWIFDEFLAKL